MMDPIKVFLTDVLIIGGGISALVAANKAAEQGVEVLIADKSTAGWSGQMPLSGGNFICAPPDKVDIQTKFYIEACDYLNDQEYTEAFASAMYPAAQEVSDWGIFSFDKDFNGNIVFSRGGGAIRMSTPHLALPMMLDRAIKKGAKTLNKVYIIELLKKDFIRFFYKTPPNGLSFHVTLARVYP